MDKFNFDEYGDFEITPTVQENTILPWVEKFRPQVLDDIVSNNSIVASIKDYVKKKYLPHLLICGPSGTGKTSIINACAQELYGDYAGMMTLNIKASEERGIEIIRNKVKDFVMTKSIFDNCADFKLIILDEADAMTNSAQGMLRRMIEDFTVNARFCLICNKLKNIDPAIQSRCVLIRFGQLQSTDIYKKIETICKKEKIKYDRDGLELIIKISRGDMRKVLNNLQSVYMGYKYISYDNVSECLGYPHQIDINSIYKILINNTLQEANKLVSKIIIDNQYMLLDIINEIHAILIIKLSNKKLDVNKFKNIIMNLKNLENNSLISTSEKILISNFISCFFN